MFRRTALPVFVLSCLLAASVLFASLARAQDSPASSIPVFVSDFELSAAAPPSTPSPAATGKKPTAPKQDAPPAVFEPSDAPSAQARRLLDYFNLTLIDTLQKRGYTATRQAGGRPEKGVLLRGVFGEADPDNRIRRAILGGGAPTARLLLYVGTFNLARPEEPLYQQATQQTADARYGPIISVNNYIPLARFELSKNPTEDEVRKISTQIVENLTTLLKNNPTAFGQ